MFKIKWLWNFYYYCDMFSFLFSHHNNSSYYSSNPQKVENGTTNVVSWRNFKQENKKGIVQFWCEVPRKHNTDVRKLINQQIIFLFSTLIKVFFLIDKYAHPIYIIKSFDLLLFLNIIQISTLFLIHIIFEVNIFSIG